MIQFFATHAHRYTIQSFLDSWAEECRGAINVHSYERFPLASPLVGGLCVFSDLERLHPSEMWLARKLAESLLAFPRRYTIVNDPQKYRGRFDLLKLLHERGLNHFGARRLDESREDLKFPVFLRSELEHAMTSPLLHSEQELHTAIRKIPFKRRRQKKHFMIVEFCDCKDADGLIRKYSVMNIRGKFFPRHIFFSRGWVVKGADLVSDELVEEENRFMDDFPHAELVRDAFRLCGLEYGRIDYSFHHGQIQVWEINSNPMIVPRHELIAAPRLPAQTRSARIISAALKELGKIAPSEKFPFRVKDFFLAQAVQFQSRLFYENRP